MGTCHRHPSRCPGIQALDLESKSSPGIQVLDSVLESSPGFGVKINSLDPDHGFCVKTKSSYPGPGFGVEIKSCSSASPSPKVFTTGRQRSHPFPTFTKCHNPNSLVGFPHILTVCLQISELSFFLSGSPRNDRQESR